MAKNMKVKSQSIPALETGLLKIIVVAGIYFWAARLGLSTAFEDTNACPVWPPAGVALAAILLLGYRIWPGIAIGAFFANVVVFTNNGQPVGATTLMSCLISSGNTLEAVCGAFLIRRFVGLRSPFDRAYDVFKFIVFAAVIASTVSATIGVFSLYVGGIATWAGFGYVWLTWWVGDAVGALVVAPALVVWTLQDWASWKSTRLAEEALVFGLLAIVTWLTFRVPPGSTSLGPLHLEYSVIPIIVWATFRFTQRGATLSVLMVAAIAVWYTVHGLGPCAIGHANESLQLVQSYLATVTVTALILAGVLTERKKTAEALRQNESSLAKAQQIAHLGNWDWDIGKNELLWSDEIYRIFGLKPHGFGATYEAFLNSVHPDDREFVKKSVNEAVAERKPYSIDHRIILPDGTKRIVHEQAEVFYDDAGKPTSMLGTVQDITEQRISAQKLESYTAELERSNRELQDFANIASHDLQEPLRKVRAFSERLLKEIDNDINDKGHEYLSRMWNALDRMQSLINGLLCYSRVTTRAQPFIRTDLNKVVREVLADLEVHVEQTGACVELSLLPRIDADPVQMQQLFSNLISNSLKFHKPGEKPAIKISSRSLNDWTPDDTSSANTFCQVVVRDDGIGFDERHLDRIFKVFQRLHSRSEYEGSGIGLAICRKIVQRHAGHITAKSSPGNGCSFFVSLPIKQVGQGDEGERELEASHHLVSS